MTIFVFIFGITTVVWLCYWAIVRPFILDSAQDELRRMRSALDWAIIEDALGARTEAAQMLSKDLEHSDAIRASSLSPSIVAGLFRRAEVKIEMERERNIYNNCQPWLREMRQRQTQVCVKAALANSPTWWIPLSLILLAGMFSLSIQKWWQETETVTGKLKSEQLPCRA
jgi:type II secretory pathway component PulM